MKKLFTLFFTLLFAASLVAQCDPILNPCLPVEIQYFNAQSVKGGVQLNWATASETNSSHFVVEKSFDAKEWTVLAKIKTFNKPSNYSFDDASNLSAYYRLSEVGTDEKIEVFKAIFVERFSSKLEVFPNPSVGAVTISSKRNVEIYNSVGILVRRTDVGETRISNLPQGLYVAKSGAETVLLVVQ